MTYVYLTETLRESEKCPVSGRNVTAYTSSLKAYKSFPVGSQAEWSCKVAR
jgi:hypothetical protein